MEDLLQVTVDVVGWLLNPFAVMLAVGWVVSLFAFGRDGGR